MKGMSTFGGLALVLRAASQPVVNADPLDHQHVVLHDDVAFGLGGQVPSTRVDPTRFQRAPQCPRQSAGCRRDDVVESGGMVGVLPGSGAVVVPDLVVGAEHDGLRLCRKLRVADGSAVPDDPYPRDVGRLVFHDSTMA